MTPSIPSLVDACRSYQARMGGGQVHECNLRVWGVDLVEAGKGGEIPRGIWSNLHRNDWKSEAPVQVLGNTHEQIWLVVWNIFYFSIYWE